MTAPTPATARHGAPRRALGLAALLALGLLAPGARAEFSPLSIHEEGLGLPVAPMGARERALGEGGLASVTTRGGVFLPNVSRTAFYDRTVFTATLEGDATLLRDDDRSSRIGSGGFPTLGTVIKTRNFGAFGAFYQQAYQRRFEVASPLSPSENVPEQRYLAEGGLYLLGLSWGYAPLPWLALGVSQSVAIGQSRTILTADFDGTAPPEAEDLEGDTLRVTRQGSYPTVSATVRTRHVDFAVSYAHSADLDVTRERRGDRLLADTLAEGFAQSLPKTLALGAAWKPDRRQTVSADFGYQAWEGPGLINPAWNVGLGYELRGSENPFDGLLERAAWRVGAGYKVLYLGEVPEVFATVGAGLPLGMRGHMLDVSLKYGHRGDDGITFFAEDYVKLSASIVGVSVWGQPARKRR